MKYLAPVITKAEYYEELEKTINDFFIEFLEEITNIINKNIQMLNSKNIIQDALNVGRIQYINGTFQGKFNASIVKELKKLGASYNKKTNSYSVDMASLPFNIQSQISISKTRFEKVHTEIIKYLDDMQNENVLKSKINEIPIENGYLNTLSNIDNEFQKTMIGVVDYQRSQDINENLAKDYANNLKLYIENFTKDNIINLRKQVLNNTFNGYRAENLIKIIKMNYNVSQSKANFLARQETNLLVASFREQRYKDVGVQKYKWRVRGFHTRPDHKALDGKIFFWDNPPVVNRETGERKHPGQDWNCYCTAIPIVEF
ncbi:hypothetical protein EOM39_01275 [Candidatus Gracilibacteria bacterium]|nr:hypothetical protein [Candidatus Gracilibacteria bacterium]